MIRSILLVSMVIVSAMAIAKAPSPYCDAHQTIREVPLSLGESLSHSLQNTFYGYNLDISILSNSSNFARVTKKNQMIDRRGGYLPNIISHYVQHKGNNWGRESFVLYRDMTGSHIFTYGVMRDQTHVPPADFTVIVSSDPNVKCFGAALLLDYGLAIIDCLQPVLHQSFTLQNYFYYVDLTSHNVTRKVKNSMYVKYTNVTKRKLMKYRDAQTNFEYLLRVYPADGVNMQQRHNTYMEIFSIRDPYDIQIMKVIDRTYCHISTLSIIDAKVYLGDIFFLDYFHGLYRLDILANNDVLITGRYAKDGFTKFAIYSDDLENEVLIALSNNHAVYEIDWSNIRDPVMITKYSLMEHSQVKQLIINDLFVVVQSAANATNETHPSFQVDYTWIFSRNSRTYTNAFSVISHNSSKVEVQFNRATDKLLIFDEEGVSLYQLNAPILTLALGEEGRVGTSEDVVLIGTSTDPNSKDKMMCQLKVKVNFVRSDNMTIYNESLLTLTNYTTNHPGQVLINLDRYVLGPNITYTLTNITGTEVDKNHTWWVNKINKTKLQLDFNIGDSIFFHLQVVPQYGQQRLIYYVQDSRFFTHVIECVHLWESTEANCIEQAKYAHQSQITSFTTAWFKDSQGFNYFYMIVFKQDLKTIRVIDYTRHKVIANITYGGHTENQITSLGSSNGFLYVLRGMMKTVDVYRLQDCQIQGSCKPDFKISAETLKPKGVNYFAPEQIVTDAAHPQVVFLKCRGSILILDIDNKQNLIVLDEIISSATMNSFYRIAVNRRRMVVVSDPDIIDQYSLEHIYIKNEVRFVKRLPIYNYKIQAISDIQYSDFEDLVYINAIDPVRNISVILIYRTNRPAATALYATIPLKKIYSRPGLQIQVSGFYVDFLNIKTDDGFTMYRVFNQPTLMLVDVAKNIKFNINFDNGAYKLQSEQHNVTAVDYRAGFIATPQLNKTINNLKLDAHGNYTWADRKWFIGHILSYNFSCIECGEDDKAKVHVREHVDPLRTLHISAYDFAETLNGGVAVYEDLIRFRLNGSFHDIINLPDQKFLERCVRVATAWHTDLIVTACQQLGRGINIYVTSVANFKPWTWGPYRSAAYNCRKLQIAGDILMITDTSIYPEYKFESGQIFLYQLGFDNVSGQQMDQLQVIDENDLTGARGFKGNKVYLGNSHLVFSAINNVYRLYITEVDNGLFVVDFTHELFRRQINIVTVNFIDLKALLQKQGFYMPAGASFQAVTLVSYKYNPHFYMETVLVTTKGFHNFEILLVFDDDGNCLSSIIDKVLYRYGFYDTLNEVKYSMGYVAISYTIPYLFQYTTNFTRQIVAVYDVLDYEGEHHDGYTQRYMMGAVRHNKTAPLMFAFNTTYDIHSNGTRTGLVVTNPYDAPNKNMQELSLSRNLTIEVRKDFKDQTITLIPFSDFDVKSFEIRLINNGGDQLKNEIILIIIIVLAVLITIGFGVYIFFLIKNKKKQRDQDRRSLLTDEQTTRHTIQPVAGQYQPPVVSVPGERKPQKLEQQASESSSQSSSEQKPGQEEEKKEISQSAPLVVEKAQVSQPIPQQKPVQVVQAEQPQATNAQVAAQQAQKVQN